MLPDKNRYYRVATHPALAKTAYFDERFHRDAVKLLPGEFYFSDADPVLVTVLGSCVAACIRDARSGIGGMNHFMLPASSREGEDTGNTMIYGAQALDTLIDSLLELGARFDNLEAKIFGGAHVASGMVNTDIGERNGQFASEYLSKRGIPVRAVDLGGTLARKLYFFPSTGQVLVRRLATLANDTIQKRDRDYAGFIKPKLK